ncbi:MAG: hypothetical protein WC745_01170 [Patescibacteria group bacterium]|jgi:hypothetical protein
MKEILDNPLEQYQEIESKTAKNENKKEKWTAKIRKALSIFIATGLVTLSADPVLDSKIYFNENHIGKFIEYTGEDNEIKQLEMEYRLKELCEKYSVNIVGFLKTADEGARENREKEKGPLKVEGFESLGIFNEDLKEMWDETYPKNALNEVSRVAYISKSKQNVGDYNISGQMMAAGTNILSNEITFFKSLEGHSKKKDIIGTADWFFSHELGHMNDWAHTDNLTPEERIEFLQEVTQSFLMEGSFRDVLGYVDSINNPDQQKQLFYKVGEYWAGLCEYYFTFPDIQFNSLETALIEKWLLKGEKFDNLAMKEKRVGYVKKMLETNYYDKK